MEIYTYALGGNTFALASYPFTRCPYDTEQHFATKPKDVALLSVCRQIHSETRLVPFKENTFYALGIYQLLTKLKGFKFKSFQIAAFQRIRLSCDMRMYTGIERFLETVTGQREEEIMYFSRMLPGVRHVYINAQICWCGWCTAIDLFPGNHEEVYRKDMMDVLKAWMLVGDEGRLQIECSPLFREVEVRG
jgi:hypothetical protein